MADQVRKQTDKKLKQMEKKISNIYAEAQEDISSKWNVFMKSHYPKLKDAQEQLKKAELTGDADEIKKAKDLYERTAMNITINNRRYRGMVEDTTEKIAHTNEIALAYINNQLPEIYTINYNAFGEEKIKGYSFSLVNESAIKELATKDKTLLPTKKLDIPKDMRWNAKNINSQVLQGILQGESIPDMAKRLRNVTDMNQVSAIRNARTMTTAAENKGKQDSYKKASDDGVIMKRIWVATPDERTRAWHADLNGVEVDVDEPWENEYGEIMEPGDPSADPANVYNCRCTMRAVVKGFVWNDEGSAEEEAVEVPSIATSKEVKPEIELTDPVQRITDSMTDSYEYHRIHNGLNETPVDEIGDYFKVQLTKMDDDVKEAMTSQFESLSSKYDTTIKELRPMGKMEYLDGKNVFARTWHDYETDSSTMIYNPVKINDIDRIKELVNNGFATQINEEFANKYVITHEFAHTLIDMGTELDPKRNWVNADYERIKSIRKDITSVYDRYIEELGVLDKAQKEAELDALSTFNEESWKKATDLSAELKEKSIGRYSMANADEFMAECFTHHELGGKQNDYVDEIMDIINKNFRR